MNRKTRIIISCILVVFAFGMGLFAYAQANGNNTAMADGGTGFFVDGNGKIAIPSGGTDEEAKKNRGTEDNPFFVLEIAPWEGLAHFGYLIDGCEPVNVWEMCLDGKSENVYGKAGNSLYENGSPVTYTYWEDEVPDWLRSRLPSPNNGTPQYGTMEYVGEGNGNYKLAEGKCEEAEGGDYLWKKLSVEECKKINWPENQNYINSERKQGESFLYCFNSPCPNHYEGTIQTISHKNTFLRESIGLAYEFDENGIRYALPEEKVQERIEKYKTVVYTVTPEDLNMNLELIERADLIFFASDASASEAINAYKGGYAKQEYFSHDESTVLGKRKENKEGADFTTNQLDWSAVLKIYERALDKEKACPIVWDTHIENKIAADHTKAVTLNGTFADGAEINWSMAAGTQNNLYKLYLLLYMMPAATFDVLYGDPGSFPTAAVDRDDVTDKQGNKLQTGLLSWYTSADAKSYWGQYSFYPWDLLPKKDESTFIPILDSLEIMGNGGGDIYHFDAGAAQNCVRNGFFLTDGGTQFFSTFDKEVSGVGKNQYNYDIYNYFKNIGLGDKEHLSPAECLYYLLHGVTEDSATNIDNYKILELQPSPVYHTEMFWKTFFATYTNTTGTITVDQMTTSEFIGKNIECISEYDLIYIGMNKLAADPAMHSNYTYAHTGPRVTLPKPEEYVTKKMFGWLGSGLEDIENNFVYSGNDLTLAAKESLKKYVSSGSALLFGNGFFADAAATTANSTAPQIIDRNSNMYDLQKEIGTSKHLYEGALVSAAHHIKAKTDLRVALANARSVELIDCKSPRLYDEAKSNAEKYIDSDRTLKYDFTLKAPAGNLYALKLYVDINGDGRFAPEEDIDVNVYEVLPNGNRGNIIDRTTLRGGKRYIVERTVLDRVGSVSWKLDIVKGGTVYKSLEGVSAIRADSSEVEDLCILQILPKEKEYFPCTVYLPQNGEVSGDTVTGLPSGTPDAIKAVTAKFWDLTRDINGMNIEFVRKTQDEVNEALNGNPNYLRENYDMLILGFADMYESVTLPDVTDAIDDYIKSGRAVLFTHDSAAFTGAGGWGVAFTEKFRDIFGMDRYDVLKYGAETGEARGDFPYLPIYRSADKAGNLMSEAVSGSNHYLLTQGFTNPTLLRFMNASAENHYDGKFFEATKASQVNRGAITEYPYKIPQNIAVATTHPQYYQLDLERNDVVVWYCLSGENAADSVVKSYYKATPNDVRNNYYIYNVGNVTYSGIGHNGFMTEDEIKLFINTFVAAYRATAKPVRTVIVNDDAVLNYNKYFMCVDVNSSDAGKAFGNDIVESYRLQKTDGSGYALDTTETAQSKRVYFYIKNANTYGNVEYGLKLSVDGTETPLAIFKKAGDVFMDGKTDSTKFKASAADVYYVDVPLTLETVGSEHAIGTTELQIDITMTYGTGADRTTTDPSETLAYIIPRGLFDLD